MEKPSARCSNNSMMRHSLTGDKGRPHRHLQVDAVHERAQADQHQHHRVEQRALPAELVAGHRRHQHQHEHRQHHAQRLEQQAEQHHRAEDPQQRLQVPARQVVLFALGRQRGQQHHRPQHREHQAQQEWKISGSHLGGRSHGIAASDPGKAQPDQNEHQAGGKVLLAAYAQSDSPQSSRNAVPGAHWLGRANACRTACSPTVDPNLRDVIFQVPFICPLLGVFTNNPLKQGKNRPPDPSKYITT
ncbi:hypothetical protein CBM2629_B10004 [Cupriavidus taiwanensis]|nr:hypothetical protein CBM2629_B10004 [Cupriavidus taiwanensis]